MDPLDGTVNFLFGIPQWCVSVAVRDEHGTVAGAIYDPNRNELFTATREGRPRLIGPAGALELTGRPAPFERRGADAAGGNRNAEPGADGPEAGGGEAGGGEAGGGELAVAMVATGFAYDAEVRAAQARVLERLLPRVRDVRRCGSAALDLGWTAAGRYDAYFERTVKPWDIAAGALICERAGLVVLELPVHGQLPWGILVARPSLAESLLEVVAAPG